MNDQEHRDDDQHEEFGLASFEDDRLVAVLSRTIRAAVRALAVVMTFVIVWGAVDVMWVLYQRIVAPPILILEITDILATFSAFMAVLIAIEIFINIVMYLKDNVIHVNLVLATALMAIARKVIVLDFSEIEPLYVFATAAVVLALSIGYWLLHSVSDRRPNLRDL
ncbi:MAG: phosphate-starvation-inducible PsiE family protein [Pseudomonadales bacterium]